MKREVRILPRIRIYRGEAIALGPGKADLLRAIAEGGSISEAARSLGMSYKRAWDLIETMNAQFAEPLVATRTGGTRGGGAALTKSGEVVLDLYERMNRKALAATRTEVRAITRRLRR
jgi:molybdate transport system regulatory protein